MGVVMPALNEAAALRAGLVRLAATGVGQIVVADNGSTDETAAVAAAAGATVAHAPIRGYGAACWAGMQALRDDVRVVVFMDADGSDDPAGLAGLIAPILEGRADLVIGTRAGALCEPGALSVQQRFGNWLATRLIRLRWGFAFRDLGPFRAIHRAALDRVAMRDRAYGWTVEMQIRALQEGLRIEQIDVPYRRRTSGTSKVGGSIKGSILAGYWILTTIARHVGRGRGALR